MTGDQTFDVDHHVSGRQEKEEDELRKFDYRAQISAIQLEHIPLERASSVK